MEKLEKGFKKKWLEALRSGDYEQGTGTLCRKGKYCCLGVGGKVVGMRDDTLKVNDVFDKDLWVGNVHYMKSKIPSQLINIVISSQLTRMNDLHGKSFSEIADYIEKNL